MWPLHVYGFGVLFGSLALLCLALIVVQAVMSTRRRRFTSKLQRLNAATVVLASLRSHAFVRLLKRYVSTVHATTALCLCVCDKHKLVFWRNACF